MKTQEQKNSRTNLDVKEAVHAYTQHRKSSKSRCGNKKVVCENHYWQKEKRFRNSVNIENENCTQSPKGQAVTVYLKLSTD